VRQSIHIPDKVYYAEKDAVKIYGLADGHSTNLTSLNAGGKTVQVTRLMHSLKQGIVVAFLQATDSPGKGQAVVHVESTQHISLPSYAPLQNPGANTPPVAPVYLFSAGCKIQALLLSSCTQPECPGS